MRRRAPGCPSSPYSFGRRKRMAKCGRALRRAGGCISRCCGWTNRCERRARGWWCGAGRWQKRWQRSLRRRMLTASFRIASTNRQRWLGKNRWMRGCGSAESLSRDSTEACCSSRVRSGPRPGDRSRYSRRFGVRFGMRAESCGSRFPPPARLSAPAAWPRSLTVADLDLEPKIDWAAGIRAAWKPGEEAAQTRLRSFARNAVNHYGSERDRTDRDGTSRMSPHLHFGEMSPLQIWHAVVDAPRGESYLRQLAWREFSYHLLCAFPETLGKPFNPQFRHFPWRSNARRLKAWQQGQTGYPMVDAGMRQLWATGWLHNRARMIVASFLVKHLLVRWQDGAAWFLDTLVDADLANNTMGWQWVAGCGVDAAPYFRVFNPVLQGEKFDPGGEYVRSWVPELRDLPSEWIHQPWAAPPLVLAAAGVVLGKTYPQPIVDHARSARHGAAGVRDDEEVRTQTIAGRVSVAIRSWRGSCPSCAR